MDKELSQAPDFIMPSGPAPTAPPQPEPLPPEPEPALKQAPADAPAVATPRRTLALGLATGIALTLLLIPTQAQHPPTASTSLTGDIRTVEASTTSTTQTKTAEDVTGEILDIRHNPDGQTITVLIGNTSLDAHMYQIQATQPVQTGSGDPALTQLPPEPAADSREGTPGAATTGTVWLLGQESTPLSTGDIESLRIPIQLNPEATEGFFTLTLTANNPEGAEPLDVAIMSLSPDCDPTNLTSGYYCWNQPTDR